jgi:hypothetical protein
MLVLSVVILKNVVDILNYVPDLLSISQRYCLEAQRSIAVFTSKVFV